MADLEFAEPGISQTLRQLMRGGWIQYAGSHDHIDEWEIAEKGRRLCATSLIKRFPIAEGRAAAERVIAEARAVNADPASSRRVTGIILFGSVLTGKDEDDAGDVDLVVEVCRRRLDAETLERLETAEKADMPSSLRFLDQLFYASNQILRRIKKVSNKISLHRKDELEELGAPCRTIYSYDLQQEIELEPDAAIRVVKRSETEKIEELPAVEEATPPSVRLDWPVAPNEPAVLNYVDIELLREAQHMWISGASLSRISERTRLPADAVQGYLASRRDAVETGAPRFDAGLRRMTSQGLIDRRCLISVGVTIRPGGGGPVIETNVYDPDDYQALANIRQFSPRRRIFQGRCDLFPIAEPVNDLAWAWFQRTRKHVQGVGLEARTWFAPDDCPEPFETGKPVDFRSFAAPMLALLDGIVPTPCPRYGHYNHRLEIELQAPFALYHCDDESRRGNSTRTRIPKSKAKALWAAATAFYERFGDVLQNDGGDYTVSVSGDQLARAELEWRNEEVTDAFCDD